MPLPKNVRLPATLHSATGRMHWASRVPDETIRRSLKGKRILIVENEPLSGDGHWSKFDGGRCKVREPAGTVEKARELIRKSDCEVTLLDANLSGDRSPSAAALTQCEMSEYRRQALPQGEASCADLGPQSCARGACRTDGLLPCRRAHSGAVVVTRRLPALGAWQSFEQSAVPDEQTTVPDVD